MATNSFDLRNKYPVTTPATQATRGLQRAVDEAQKPSPRVAGFDNRI